MKRAATQLPVTERPNPRSTRLDRLPTRRLLRLISFEDRQVPLAVARTIPQIARAVEVAVAALRRGGRLFYVGAGTSGRLGVLDAAEIPPTFHVSPRRVEAILAGGRRAMFRSAEAAEDSEAAARRDLARHRLSARDAVLVLTASGTTPYALGALRYARKRRTASIAVSSNPASPAARLASIAICPRTGPEVIAGSTRLKAGTAQKLVLNMLSTAVMVRLGHVYGNLMVNVMMSNRKLRTRGRRVLMRAVGCDRATAERLIRASQGNLKVAIVMGELGCTRVEAQRRLRVADGVVRRALGEK
ncbi:MAG: N-acetylmuramic acid 6-phosphate etherase [Terriglobia bacterium]